MGINIITHEYNLGSLDPQESQLYSDIYIIYVIPRLFRNPSMQKYSNT